MADQQFLELVSKLLSPDNTQRGEAEAALNALKTKDPNNLVLALLATARFATAAPEVRQMAVTALRPMLVKDKETIWATLTPETQSAVKAEMLNIIQNERASGVLRKASDTIADLCTFLADKGGWAELLPFMFTCATSQEETHKECSLNIFAQLAILLGADTFRQHFTVVRDLLQHALADTRIKVKLAALNATSAFLQIMEKEDDAHVTQFQQLLPLMLECISSALNQQQEQEAQKALEMFVELAEVEPNFFKASLPTVISAMMQIAQAASLNDETRRYALEVLLTLCEVKPVMMKKQPEFVKAMVYLLLSWMVGVQDYKEWYDFEDPDEIGNDDVAEEAIDRFCIALKGKVVVPVLFSSINALVTNADWRQRHAGVMAISFAAEGCKFVLKKHMAEIMNFITPLLTDTHPRVRWAAANCIGQLCTDFAPEYQQENAATLVPQMLNVMSDPIVRVAAHGATCIINFVEGAPNETVVAHMNAILGKLHALLQSAPIRVQEGVITALSTVVESAQEQFAQYYDLFVPYLKMVVQKAQGQKEYRLIRGKAMESLSLIGCAVKKEIFARDAREVLDLMMQTQVVEADDPQIAYLESAFARLAECLGKDFAPYLSVVMPSALQRASMKADVAVLNSSEQVQEGWEVYSLGDKSIGIHTSQLEDKASATQILLCYAHSLGAAFFPYVEQVARIVVNNMAFYYNDDVRSAIAGLASEVLKITAEHLKETNATDMTPLKQAFDWIFEALLKSLPDEPEVDIRCGLLSAFKDSLDIVGGPCIAADRMPAIAELFKTMLNEWIDQKNHRDEKENAGEFDEEDEEALEEHDAMQDEALGGISDAIAAVFRCHGTAFLQPFHDYILPVVAAMLRPERCATERQKAICMLDDLVEWTGQASVGLLQHYIQPMLAGTQDKEPAIIQASVYGLGVCGKVLGDHFAPYVNDALARLQAIVSSPLPKDNEDFKYAMDNAVAAVGKIVFGQGARVSPVPIISAWVQRLPLRSDEIESRICNGLMITFFEQLGAQLVPSAVEAIRVLAEVAETDLLLPEDVPRAANLVKQLGAVAGVAQAVAGRLTAEQSAKLQRLAALATV
eukprot:m51a1_g741 putative arm repeat superfamily protein isoform 1 (1083) ;mRNA; f:497898-501852